MRAHDHLESRADLQGWCALGDLALLDGRGYLYLRGRLDRMINTGSYHVYPDDVEEAISAVPGVGAVHVTGEPDPKWGQAVIAYVVIDDEADPEDLVGRIQSELPTRLARYKIPQAVRIVDTLPK